MVKEICCHAY